MNRFFKKIKESLISEIRFINTMERLVATGKIDVRVSKDSIRRPRKPKENYFEIQIMDTPNRLIQFLYKTKVFIIGTVYVYERPQQHKNIYTHLHHVLFIDSKQEMNKESAVKVFKNWIETIFNVDIDVIIVDSK